VAAGPNGLHAGVGPGPAGQVVVIKRGMFPMIGRPQIAWKRAELKAAKREARWVRRTDAALRRIHQLRAVVRRSAEVFVAWAGVTLAELRHRLDLLLDRIAFAGEAWLDRVPGGEPGAAASPSPDRGGAAARS
jgi:hypothetical protein